MNVSADALHGCVGFQRGGIDADRFALQQVLLQGDGQHEAEDFLMHFRGSRWRMRVMRE